MKKQTIAIAIFGILAISFVSASLVPFLSNTVTASIEVTGPVFYAGAGNILSLNEPTNSIHIYEINNDEMEKFWSDEFESPLDFYPMEVDMQIRARVDEGNLSKRLRIEFGFVRGDNLDNICTREVLVNSRDFKTYSKSCIKKYSTNNVDGFYYKVEGMGIEGVQYGVQIGDTETQIKINGYEEQNE